MKKIGIVFACIAMLASCSKDYGSNSIATPVTDPVTEDSTTIFNLIDRRVGFNQSVAFDLNRDGSPEFYFFTMLVGDPILKRDYRQFLIGTSITTYLQVSEQEEAPVLAAGQRIDSAGLPNFHWYNAAQVVLARKVIPYGENYWEGNFKDVSHRYIPLQILWQNQPHFAWVEVSLDTVAEQITVHGAGVQNKAGKPVIAGK